MPNTAVCFDLDGTLVDSAPGIAASLDYAVLAVTGKSPITDWTKFIGPPLETCIIHALPYLNQEQITMVVGEFRRHYDSIGLQATTAYPDTCTVLQALAESGIASYVVTNKPIHAASLMVSHLGMDKYVRRVVGGDTRFSYANDNVVSKAERTAQLVTQEEIHVEWMVGDGLDDLHAADRIGAQFLLAEWGYGVANVIADRPGVKKLSRLADLLEHI